MSLDTILNIMSEYKLTADELLLVYLTFIAQSENGGNTNYFLRWYDSCGKYNLKNLFESLKEKGVILKNYNPSAYIPEEIEFNSNFLKKYFKLTGQLGQELYNAYPSYMYINGKIVSLKNISKIFRDLNELYFKYASIIKHSVDKHKEILDILEWAKSQDLVTISLPEFIISCKWNEYKELRDKGVQGKADISEIYELV